MMMYR